MRDKDCVEFLRWCLPRLRLRWKGFRKVRRQVCRRIARRLRELDLPDLGAYRARLDARPVEWDILDALCRVTISRFCRDRAVFAGLGEAVLPELARGRKVLRCWSAGCASGEEPYALKILWETDLRPRLPGVDLRIVATDVDSVLLERAHRATYPPGALRELPADQLAAAFDPEDGAMRLRDRFRGGIRFLRQDLRRRQPRGPFDLILCRNLVFTYFDEALARQMLGRLAAHLRRGGALVVGIHESLPAGAADFVPWPSARCVYRRL